MSSSLVTVHVLEGRNLAAADSNGLSDPYVMVVVGSQKKKSPVAKKTLNPIWNQSFVVDLAGESEIVVNVFDWDLGSRDDFLGQVIIPVYDLNTTGVSNWYPLSQKKNAKTPSKVSGEIALAFAKVTRLSNPGTPTGSARGSKELSSADIIKIRFQDSQEHSQGKDLDLSAIKLVKIPQTALENYQRTATNLNLSFNLFTVFPEESQQFVQLQQLDLTGNQIAALPPIISRLGNLRELSLNGNLLTAIPDELGELSNLEKLFIANNCVQSINHNIGKLKRLEELSLMGNPIREIPPSLGACIFMELLDLSCCQLTKIPGEFTYMTRLLELNLATNEISELPQSIGRMTRLCILNLSDNKLQDLPLSLGLCIGLAKFGAGINIERNPIKDPEMIAKFKIGPDHLLDFLEKRMLTKGVPKLEEFQVPFADIPKKKVENTSSSPQWGAKRGDSFTKDGKEEQSTTLKPVAAVKTASSPATPARSPMDDKLTVLRRWAHTTIQQEFRLKLNTLQQRIDSTVDLAVAMSVAQTVKAIKPVVDDAKTQVPAFETPKPVLNPSDSKLNQLKAVISGALGEVALALRGIQTVLDQTNSSKDILSMVQLVKNFKAQFDEIQQ